MPGRLGTPLSLLLSPNNSTCRPTATTALCSTPAAHAPAAHMQAPVSTMLQDSTGPGSSHIQHRGSYQVTSGMQSMLLPTKALARCSHWHGPQRTPQCQVWMSHSTTGMQQSQILQNKCRSSNTKSRGWCSRSSGSRSSRRCCRQRCITGWAGVSAAWCQHSSCVCAMMSPPLYVTGNSAECLLQRSKWLVATAL